METSSAADKIKWVHDAKSALCDFVPSDHKPTMPPTTIERQTDDPFDGEETETDTEYGNDGKEDTPFGGFEKVFQKIQYAHRNGRRVRGFLVAQTILNPAFVTSMWNASQKIPVISVDDHSTTYMPPFRPGEVRRTSNGSVFAQDDVRLGLLSDNGSQTMDSMMLCDFSALPTPHRDFITWANRQLPYVSFNHAIDTRHLDGTNMLPPDYGNNDSGVSWSMVVKMGEPRRFVITCKKTKTIIFDELLLTGSVVLVRSDIVDSITMHSVSPTPGTSEETGSIILRYIATSTPWMEHFGRIVNDRPQHHLNKKRRSSETPFKLSMKEHPFLGLTSYEIEAQNLQSTYWGEKMFKLACRMERRTITV